MELQAGRRDEALHGRGLRWRRQPRLLQGVNYLILMCSLLIHLRQPRLLQGTDTDVLSLDDKPITYYVLLLTTTYYHLLLLIVFFKDNTVMLLGDAKVTLEAIKAELAK